MKKKSIWTKISVYISVIILLLGGLYYFIGKEQLRYTYYGMECSSVETTISVGELLDGAIVEQEYTNASDMVQGIIVRFSNYGNEAYGSVTISIRADEEYIASGIVCKASDFPDCGDFYIDFERDVPVERGQRICITMEFAGGVPGHALAVMAGDELENCPMTIDGQPTGYSMYMVPSSYRDSNYTTVYCTGVAVVLLAICWMEYKKEQKNIKTPLSEFIQIFGCYRFLLGQLVSRDFKNKYRRSYLGILWSLLNPLLMMIIVSAVFSFVFRFQIQNFQVYLILGQFIFNFFSEATQVSLQTVCGNAQLIKKVYLPKYIFPLSKTVFSFINSLISLIAVVLVMFYYRVPLTVNVLYLPILFITYFMFTLGVGLTLSALTVFLRDTQYLYGLVITALGYLTPIFYPIDSLAPWMQYLIKLNPLYHYLSFFRTVMLYGSAPSISSVLVCVGLGLSVFLFGLSFFFKKQNRFILYI